MGGLEARVLEPHGRATRAVVLCHGFGAPGDNLVWMGDALMQDPAVSASTLFVFPSAPLSLDSVGLRGSRAWWLFDFLRLAEAGVAGALDVLRRDVPEGMAKARRQLIALLDQVERESGLPRGRVVLGGFSQGAMLATDTALRLEEPPQALCVFSGTLTCDQEWARRAPRRAGLRVVQTHGRRDPLCSPSRVLSPCATSSPALAWSWTSMPSMERIRSAKWAWTRCATFSATSPDFPAIVSIDEDAEPPAQQRVRGGHREVVRPARREQLEERVRERDDHGQDDPRQGQVPREDDGQAERPARPGIPPPCLRPTCD